MIVMYERRWRFSLVEPAPASQPASMWWDSDSDSESDCDYEPESQSDSESEPEPEPVTQPTPRRCSARLAALAPEAPTGHPLPLDSEVPVMLRHLKEFCKLIANPNCKGVYNQLQQRLVRKGHRKGIAEQREFEFDPALQIGVGIDPGVTQAVSAASGLDWWKLTKSQVKHASGLNNARRDTERWLAPTKPHLQHLAAASSAGTSLEANLKHITVTLATWDAVWEVYLDPKWARQRLRLYGAQDRALERFFKQDMAEVSMERHGRAKPLVAFFRAAGIGTVGGWGADAVLRASCKVVCRPRGADQRGGRVVLVDEHRTTRVSSAVNGQQPCERQLNKRRATRPADWKPPAGQVDLRLLRPAWSQQRDQPVRGLMWCPVVAPRKPPQAPCSQAASQAAASEPGPSTPPPAKRTKRTKTEQATEPNKAQGKAANAKPAPQPGRRLDRDCNAALNMQRIVESRWRPLELCWWPEQGALPAKSKEFPGLGYKRLRDKPPI
ncbi:hypothetical protein QJQ45_012590 [Haematococcus lacustris]|nr:hypothetical protein QJQ45_012590 [Haematococcus lacustris]